MQSSKHSHWKYLGDMLKALLKSGLKISSKKYQHFRAELKYMGYNIFIKDERVCLKPFETRLEAIQKLKLPKMAKDCM